MSNIEDEFEAVGARLIWVIQEDTTFGAASSGIAHALVGGLFGSEAGLRVGDGETLPEAGVFDRSPFITTNRGFVMVVRRSDMNVRFGANYSSLSAQELLEEAAQEGD